MRHTPSSLQSAGQVRTRAAILVDDQQALMRGIVHAVLLSMIMWAGALYLTTLALR